MSESLGSCLKSVLLAMIVADEDVDPDEIVVAERAYDEFVGEALPDGTLTELAAEARAAGRSATEVLACLPRDLPAHLQDQVLTAAFRVASADGFVLEEEDEMLRAVAAAMGMDPARTRGVLNGLMG